MPGVRTKVGATALTVTPCGLHSNASTRVSMFTPPLLAEYTNVPRDPNQPCLRAEAHDAPVPALNHRAADGLRQEEEALEVDVHHRVPVGLGHVDGVVVRPKSGVVDQDVDLSSWSASARSTARLIESPSVTSSSSANAGAAPAGHLRNQLGPRRPWTVRPRRRSLRRLPARSPGHARSRARRH